MSKPAHRGRVFVPSSMLPNLTDQHNGNKRNNNPQPPAFSAAHPRRGSGASASDARKGSLSAAGISALGGMSKDRLQRRVNELEGDNQRLQSCLEKAELSIESYKGFLSAKSAQRAHSIAVQTDFLSTSNSNSNITPNKKNQVSRLTTKLEDAKKKIEKLNQEVSSLNERDKEKDLDTTDARNQFKTLKVHSELAEVSFRAQISTLESELRSLKRNRREEGDHQSPTVRTPTQSPLKHNTAASSVLLQGSNSLSASAAGAGSTPSSLDRLVHPLPDMVISPAPSAKKLKPLSSSQNLSPKHHIKHATPRSLPRKKPLPLRALHRQLQAHSSQHKTIGQAVHQDLEEFKDFFSHASAKILNGIQRAEVRRVTTLSEQTKAVSSLEEELAEAKRSHSNISHSAEEYSLMEKKFACAQTALEKELATARSALEKETDRADSMELLFDAKMTSKEADLSSLTTLFTSVSRELQNLQVKCKSEGAAVKHVGHCKDLVRVATIRELTLDRDKAFSELKYARDVQSVLAFCLETSLKSLAEEQPKVAGRLHESRLKRSAVLEREVTARRRDLDQRSAETCAVSSSHLEAFQVKSALKHKKAAEETEALFAEIQNILNIKSRR